jgi:uncharacterized protein (DUF885 family)
MIPRRSRGSALAALALAAAACSQQGSRASAPAVPPAAEVGRLAEEYFAGFIERFPEEATFLGAAQTPANRLTDLSAGARRAWEAREDAWLARLQPIDPARLPDAEAASYGIVRERIEASRASRVCRLEVWRVSQVDGWQVTIPRLGVLQRVDTPAARAAALARWRAVPHLVDQDIANLREGMRSGYTAPRGNVAAVIKQVDALLAAAPEASPYAVLAKRDSTPAFRTAVVVAVRDEINPALHRYRQFLAEEYLPVARANVGVSAIPNGADCYRARIRFYTTLPLEPRAVHELGLAQMARIEGEMRTIAERSFGTSDVPGLLQRLRTDPRYLYRSRADLIAQADSAIGRAHAAMPKWFGRLPVADVIIDPCQPFEEASGCPGSYVPPAEDGSRPGRYRINAGDPTSRPRASGEATAFHETIPGHHLQVAIAQERAGADHASRFLFNSGFAEGWALYAERLADEMGLYSSDLARLGLLSNDALRAARLVVDPGLHALGWTRQQAIDYMLAHTEQSRGFIESEVDRYIIWPGQATAYMVGRLEIERLRAQAQAKLGPRFDIRIFHDRVLEGGSVPLGVLRGRIEQWLGR